MSAERFEFEDFELHRSAYELRRAGSVVHLERIPLDLLFLLVERRGQLVTRQEIFERIWGKGVFVDTDNSINTAVRKLRHALHDDPDAPHFVVTVPAKGYRFIAPIREESPTAPVSEARPVWAVAEAGLPADAVDASSTTITKADVPLRKDRRRGIMLPIVGIAFVIAVIVLIEQLSLRPPTTTASIPPRQKSALPFPNIPSIAVLPFTNMSGDRDQEYFSDGITNDLITSQIARPLRHRSCLDLHLQRQAGKGPGSEPRTGREVRVGRRGAEGCRTGKGHCPVGGCDHRYRTLGRALRPADERHLRVTG